MLHPEVSPHSSLLHRVSVSIDRGAPRDDSESRVPYACGELEMPFMCLCVCVSVEVGI